MSRLLIEPVTPDEPGYIALKAESIALNFNMLRRLEENWLRVRTALTRRVKSCWVRFLTASWWACVASTAIRSASSHVPDAFAISTSAKCRGLGIGKQLLTVVMADASIWFDFLNTHAPDSAYGFYNRAGFTLVSDEPRVTHRLLCGVTGWRHQDVNVTVE